MTCRPQRGHCCRIILTVVTAVVRRALALSPPSLPRLQNTRLNTTTALSLQHRHHHANHQVPSPSSASSSSSSPAAAPPSLQLRLKLMMIMTIINRSSHICYFACRHHIVNILAIAWLFSTSGIFNNINDKNSCEYIATTFPFDTTIFHHHLASIITLIWPSTKSAAASA